MIARKHLDSDGRHPLHSFLSGRGVRRRILTPSQGCAATDLAMSRCICITHNDNAANLAKTPERLQSHLARASRSLRRDQLTHEIVCCFIHGNWALDNSRPRPLVRRGQRNRGAGETGCRCDMSMPSAPSDTQTKKINSIYFAQAKVRLQEIPRPWARCRSGGWRSEDELLLVPGPLGLNWPATQNPAWIPRINQPKFPPMHPDRATWRCGQNLPPGIVRRAQSRVYQSAHPRCRRKTRWTCCSGGFETLVDGARSAIPRPAWRTSCTIRVRGKWPSVLRAVRNQGRVANMRVMHGRIAGVWWCRTRSGQMPCRSATPWWCFVKNWGLKGKPSTRTFPCCAWTKVKATTGASRSGGWARTRTSHRGLAPRTTGAYFGSRNGCLAFARRGADQYSSRAVHGLRARLAGAIQAPRAPLAEHIARGGTGAWSCFRCHCRIHQHDIGIAVSRLTTIRNSIAAIEVLQITEGGRKDSGSSRLAGLAEIKNQAMMIRAFHQAGCENAGVMAGWRWPGTRQFRTAHC